MSKRKPFVIRDFSPSHEGYFKCNGVIDNLSTFAEKVEEDFLDAQTSVRVSALNADTTTSLSADVDVISIKVPTVITSKDELRTYRTDVREVIKRWSEKCRVTGTRGWRANAIKTPTFKRNKKTGEYDLRFDVILGRRVVYSTAQHKDNALDYVIEIHDDLRNLSKKLMPALGDQASTISFKHSRIGRGTV